MFSALANRDYRLLWIGQAASFLGDQFHVIAMAWLVLAITHDPVQLGIVYATVGIPRAVFMLVGGAYADRYSPRTIMLISDAARFVLVGGVAVACLTGTVQLWMIYVMALAYGVLSGFFVPAAEASVPRLLRDAALESGNALLMGVSQLAGFVGPALAGALIAYFGGAANQGADTRQAIFGLGVAFAIDSLSFAVSALTLTIMHPLPALAPHAATHPIHDVAEGLKVVWDNQAIRWLVALTALANFAWSGPYWIGLPVLAHSQFGGDARTYGLVVAACGLGSVIGMGAAAALPTPPGRLLGRVAAGILLVFGLATGAIAFAQDMWVAAALLFVCGIGNGYISVLVLARLQRMTPERLLGRVMSVFMLAVFALAPIAQALGGVVLKSSMPALFLGGAAGIVIAAGLALIKRALWETGEFAEAG
jgi:MFS family permease